MKYTLFHKLNGKLPVEKLHLTALLMFFNPSALLNEILTRLCEIFFNIIIYNAFNVYCFSMYVYDEIFT